jgi:hypothetical protein
MMNDKKKNKRYETILANGGVVGHDTEEEARKHADQEYDSHPMGANVGWRENSDWLSDRKKEYDQPHGNEVE